MKLRHYETMFLLHPDLSNEDRENAIEKFTNIIKDGSGEIVNVDPWPLRKLAYKVQKQTQGYYVVIDFGAPGDVIQELTRNYRLDERVMKFMTTKLDDEFDAAEAAKKYANKGEAEAQTESDSAESEGKEE
ncbi:MAG: 30S ribosomal protein S6 [Thermodesulfobacteria bacterium]|nr:30S ribosomal protein S6 [Thermodesulfobacteriota bacterium]